MVAVSVVISAAVLWRDVVVSTNVVSTFYVVVSLPDPLNFQKTNKV